VHMSRAKLKEANFGRELAVGLVVNDAAGTMWVVAVWGVDVEQAVRALLLQY
jgi:hypothetical protein